MKRILVALSSGVVLLACHKEASPKPVPHETASITAVAPAAGPQVVHVPRITEPITIDGEIKELAWRQRAFTSPVFAQATGKEAPFTQVKLMADDKNLYLEVYVADQDLQSKGDIVTVEIGPLKLVLTPNGPIPPGVKLATDFDGTVDKPDDYDEEWVSELAIPLDLLKSTRVPFRVERTDVGKPAPPRTVFWPKSGSVILDFAASS